MEVLSAQYCTFILQLRHWILNVIVTVLQQTYVHLQLSLEPNLYSFQLCFVTRLNLQIISSSKQTLKLMLHPYVK